MARTAAEVDPQPITFMLPGTPESVPVVRFHIRAALSFHQLDGYADNAEIITSELVTNAIQHACADGTGMIRVTLMQVRNPDAVAIVVEDSSPEGPVTHPAPDINERGRGLRVVEELSDFWGWNPEDGGKAVYAVLVKQASA